MLLLDFLPISAWCCLQKCSLFKKNLVNVRNVRNFPGTTTKRINEVVDNILQSKPDLTIIHAGISDFAIQINPLNNLRQILRKCNESSSTTKLVFSDVIVRKDKADLGRVYKGKNSRRKSFCKKKKKKKNGIGYICNSNITENRLDMKKFT